MYFQHVRYPYVPPPADRTEDVRPVAIVGGGPAGLTLALALARHNVACVVLEERDTVSEGSRALGMSRRTMDIWDQLDVAGELRRIGLPWYGGRSYYRDRLILAYENPHQPAFKHPPMTNVQQCIAEQCLVDAALASPLVDLRWQTRFSHLIQRQDRIAIEVQAPGGREEFQARYVVACDGARSAVRADLELKMEGTSFESAYVIVDVKLVTTRRLERYAWFDPASNPGSTVLMHGQPYGIWRIDYQIPKGQSLDEALEPERVAAFVARHLQAIGEDGPWEIVWVSSYRAHSRTLASYRERRVFFAGDAAHLMPIFGIRGLNSGVEDAWNLAWKLAAVLDGTGTETLLDSYSSERVAAARENIAQATRAGRFMSPPTRGYRRMRDAVLSLALREPSVRDIINPKQGALVSLVDSPLSSFAETALLDTGPHPGEIVSNFTVQPAINGRPAVFLYDLLESQMTLLAVLRASEAAVLRRLVAELRRSASVNVVVAAEPLDADAFAFADRTMHLEDVRRAGLGDTPGAVYLIRPDHHLAARWTTLRPEQITQALEIALGRSPVFAPAHEIAR